MVTQVKNYTLDTHVPRIFFFLFKQYGAKITLDAYGGETKQGDHGGSCSQWARTALYFAPCQEIFGNGGIFGCHDWRAGANGI